MGILELRWMEVHDEEGRGDPVPLKGRPNETPSTLLVRGSEGSYST